MSEEDQAIEDANARTTDDGEPETEEVTVFLLVVIDVSSKSFGLIVVFVELQISSERNLEGIILFRNLYFVLLRI